MPSISKQLLNSLQPYFDLIPKHPLTKLHEFPKEKKTPMYERVFNHLVNGAEAFSWHYKRAAEFTTNEELKKYLLNIFDDFQHGLEILQSDYKKYSGNNAAVYRMGICFALQLYESELVLCKKDVLLFLVSQLGLLTGVETMIEYVSNDLNDNFGWLTGFGGVMETKVMAEWIDRLAPKDWSQEYFEELRDICVKQLVLDFPSKYDYILTGVNAVPQVIYDTPKYID